MCVCVCVCMRAWLRTCMRVSIRVLFGYLLVDVVDKGNGGVCVH